MKKILFLIFSFFIIKVEVMAVELKSLEIGGVRIPVIYEKSDSLPLFYLQLVFKGAGGVSDGKNLGLANLSSSLLNEGTKKLGVTKFSQQLEEKALALDVGNGVETLSFMLSGMSEHKNSGILALKDLLENPNFTQKALDKVKENALISLLEKESDYDYQAEIALNKMLFKGSALEYPLKGTAESISKISLKEVESFYKKYINLESLIIVAGGDVEFESLAESLGFLQNLPQGQKPEIKPIKASGEQGFSRILKDTQQAYIYFGAPLEVKDLQKESAFVKVASFVLGGSGFGSRILEEVRVKRGLAYSASMYLDSRASKQYAFGYLQTSLKNEKEAVKIVKEVVSEFVKNGITKEELEEAKKYLLGSAPLKSETLSQRLGVAFMNYYNGLPLDFQKQVLDEISTLELESVNNYIKKHAEITELTFAIVSSDKE